MACSLLVVNAKIDDNAKQLSNLFFNEVAYYDKTMCVRLYYPAREI